LHLSETGAYVLSMVFPDHLALRLSVALGIGLLIGAERERRKGTGRYRSAAGIRTFALAALAGAVTLLVGGELLLAVSAATVAIFNTVAYRRTSHNDPGLTSEMALFATLLLGALAIVHPSAAASLGVIVTVLLAARTRLHHLIRDALTEQEAYDALLFAAASLVILPLMPNHAVGPYGVLNPRRFWELVILILAISGAGHIALRSIGPRLGLVFAGFAGGFVSATATIGSLGARAAHDRHLERGAIAGAVLASVSTIILMAIVLITVSPSTARAATLALLFPSIAAIFYSIFFLVGTSTRGKHFASEPGRAFSLRAALLFAATLFLVLLLSTVVMHRFGAAGLIVAAGLTGFADTHATAISVASLVNSGKLAAGDAVVPILMGFTTNTLTKAIVAATLGGWRFALNILPGLVIIVLAAWASLLFR